MTSHSSDPLNFINVRGTQILPRDTRDQYRQKIARIILDALSQLTGLLDAQGTVLDLNRAALENAGIRLSAVEGKPFWTTFWWQVSDEGRDKLKEAIVRAAAGETVRWDAEIYRRPGGGQTALLDVTIAPVTDVQGYVVFLVVEGREKARE